MSNYTNKNNVEKYLNYTFPSGMDAYITAWLNAVDNWIENYLGRKYKDVASATRYYDGSDCSEIYIDNFEGTPTSVLILDGDGDTVWTLTDTDDYFTAPFNETVKNRLVLKETARIGKFPQGARKVAVTANFGVTTAPADITLAATMLVSAIAEKYAHGGKIKSEAVGDVSHTFVDVDDAADAMGARNILNQYRLPQIG